MTIQNIEDVMGRIMSLNRNLTEESLKTLLSASGWDREDISEGLRIFRASDRKTIAATPVESKSVEEVVEKVEKPEIVNTFSSPTPAAENGYTFSLKREEDLSRNITSQTPASDITINNSVEPARLVEEKPVENVIVSPAAPITRVENKEIVVDKKQKYIESEVDGKNTGKGVGRIIFYLLLLALLGLLAGYLFVPSLKSFVDRNLLGKEDRVVSDSVTNLYPQNPQNINNNIPAIPNNTNSIPTSQNNPNSIPSTNTSSSSNQNNQNISQMNQDDIKKLMDEVNRLKVELSNYKQTASSGGGQTIVKYISQKGSTGATGATGRGIASVDTTSTGFVINYTDRTNDLIPYSTTTILNIINSTGVCFRDQNATTSSSTDICLDKTSVLNLLNR